MVLGFKRRICVLSCILLSTSCGKKSSDPKNIFGSDERHWVTSRAYPFSAVGKLDFGCTGSLVGKRLMLTAAHCVFDSAIQKPRMNVGVFAANLVNGLSAAESAPVRAWIGSTQPEQNREKDWAIVELGSPLGDRQGFLPLGPVEFGLALPYVANLVGYNNDINGGLTASVHYKCKIRKMSNGRALHDCSGTSGVSGGPIFVQENDEYRIVGISVSEFRNTQLPPVHRDSWSEDYTNVGVPAATFYDVAQRLRATVDEGVAAPNFVNAIVIDFAEGLSTPPVQPAPPPQPAPQPAPQPSETYYSYVQMNAAPVLWQRVGVVQSLHQLLNQNARAMENLARHSQSDSLLRAETYFQQTLNAHITGWNVLFDAGMRGILPHFNTMVLYDDYLHLKAGQVALNDEISALPEGLRQNAEDYFVLIHDHIHSIEQSVFGP